MTMDTFEDLVNEHGKSIDINMSYRMLLHDTDSIYFIKSGNVDLFSIEPIGIFAEREDAFFVEMSKNNNLFLGDFLVGPLSYLSNFQESQFLFGFLLDEVIRPYKIILKANVNTTLLKIPIDKYWEFIKSKNEMNAKLILESVIELWLVALSEGFSKFTLEKDVNFIEYGMNTTEDIQKNYILSKHSATATHMGWIDPLEGDIRFFGKIPYPELPIGLMIPFTSDLWLTLSENGQMAFYHEIPKQVTIGDLYESLLIFEQVLVVSLKVLEKEREAIELKEIEERSILTKKRTSITISRLGNILHPGKFINIEETKNKLFQAFEIITNALERKLIIPPKITDKTEEDQIYSISVASKIFTRTIALKPGWKSQASLPLLTYQIGNPQVPIAAIPNEQGNYDYVDSEHGFHKMEVDEAIEKVTLSDATMFYKSLPDKWDIKPLELLKFFSKKNIGEIYIVIFISFLTMLTGVISPFFSRMIFDSIIPSNDYMLLFQILFWMLVILIFQMACGYVRTFALMRFETLFNHDLDMSIWIRLMNLPYSFFRKYSAGDLYSRINAVSGLKSIVSSHAVALTMDALFSIVYLFVMFYFSATLAIITLCILFLLTMIDLFALTRNIQFSRETQHLSGELYGQMMQIIVGISKIKIYGVESRIFNYWANSFVELTNIGIKGIKLDMWVGTISSTITTLMSYTLMIGMVMIKYTEAPGKGLTIGEFMAFSTAFGMFNGYYSSVIGALSTYLTIIPTWERCKVILDEKPEVTEANLLNVDLKGKVEFKNIFFRYDEDSPFVHEDVSLKAEPGEFIAIVGRSGCGKSSLIQLLLGFEKPERGGIFLDDKELSSFDIQKVRSQMGVVSQNCKVVDGTIRENITGGKLCTTEEVMNAARIAEFEQLINQLPMALQTHLTQGSDTLSGGQMQRLFIARALIGNPKILILDEATNALDNTTQKTIIEHIDKLKITRIMIAHRLSTVMKADRIYVMKEGKVHESGTFDELIQKRGYFARLVELQQL